MPLLRICLHVWMQNYLRYKNSEIQSPEVSLTHLTHDSKSLVYDTYTTVCVGKWPQTLPFSVMKSKPSTRLDKVVYRFIVFMCTYVSLHAEYDAVLRITEMHVDAEISIAQNVL